MGIHIINQKIFLGIRRPVPEIHIKSISVTSHKNKEKNLATKH